MSFSKRIITGISGLLFTLAVCGLDHSDPLIVWSVIILTGLWLIHAMRRKGWL